MKENSESEGSGNALVLKKQWMQTYTYFVSTSNPVAISFIKDEMAT
jgi:hypothetical protein